ncbi:hypothetical protein PN36_11055 [Candidatus Thiomargarita nelsonii]|uniref:DUF6891 domain-containing protein n=1 Tax=Candidatus Thiomargarita nelsonii TaxID=1003181 RepID=A0A0A6P7B8_9GAMM|nr:hypothetical protein PN36_11055 [Candidatus Thiomargarita nelsonii]
MNQTEEYVFDAIKTWVWSGFYSLDEVYENIEDILEEDCDENMSLASEEYQKKLEDEKSWPDVTDCDRLNSVFEELNQQGIIAIQNAGYTMSHGFEDVGEELNTRNRSQVKGYCFYHGQDIERAVIGAGVRLAFGDLDNIDQKKVEVGEIVINVLNKHGFETEWNGTAGTRINVTNLKWQRRMY